jgi:hypothetical protein
MEGNPSESADAARETLDKVRDLRRFTRQARRAFWVPLAVYALLTLASSPLYVRVHRPDSVWHGDEGNAFGLLGGQVVEHADEAALYWLIAVPLGYLIIAGAYRWRAYRRGVAAAWRTYVLGGLILFALIALVLSNVAPPLQRAFLTYVHGNLIVRGLLPLLILAIGFLVLAGVERSLEFGVFAVGFLALALTTNLYDMSNLTTRVGFGVDRPYINNLVVGFALLAASLYFALRARGWRLVPRVTALREQRRA